MKKYGTLEKKLHRNAFLMSLPWLIGFAVFFAVPLFYTFVYSFNTLQVGSTGESTMVFNGINNYVDLFTKLTSKNNSLVLRVLATENARIFTNTPVLMIFSLFAAILINKKFKGRALARMVFFLPIILGLDIMRTMMSSSIEGNFVDASVEPIFTGDDGIMAFLLQNSLLPESVIEFMAQLNDNIFNIVSSCGVQILLFLAGLQSISESHYEVAKIEGAGSYEVFWKITLPMISNMMIFVLVYSFVDLFVGSSLSGEIYYFAFTQNNIGAGSALSVIYTINGLLDMGILLFVFRKVVAVTNA